MGMTLEEAIKHCEEKAEELERRAEEVAMNDAEGVYQPQVARCRDCASDHRQLAEWLKKLKAYEESKGKIELKAEKCPNEEIRYGMRTALYIQEKCLKEVNADGR